jgi:hypothetical protein
LRSLVADPGFNLDAVLRGFEPENWKTMKTVGTGVKELRVRDPTGAYRVIYLATRPSGLCAALFSEEDGKDGPTGYRFGQSAIKAIPRTARS